MMQGQAPAHRANVQEAQMKVFELTGDYDADHLKLVERQPQTGALVWRFFR